MDRTTPFTPRAPRRWELFTFALLGVTAASAFAGLVVLVTYLGMYRAVSTEGRSGTSAVVDLAMRHATGFDQIHFALVIAYLVAFSWWHRDTRRLLQSVGVTDAGAVKHWTVRAWNVLLLVSFAFRLLGASTTVHPYDADATRSELLSSLRKPRRGVLGPPAGSRPPADRRLADPGPGPPGGGDVARRADPAGSRPAPGSHAGRAAGADPGRCGPADGGATARRRRVLGPRERAVGGEGRRPGAAGKHVDPGTAVAAGEGRRLDRQGTCRDPGRQRRHGLSRAVRAGRLGAGGTPGRRTRHGVVGLIEDAWMLRFQLLLPTRLPVWLAQARLAGRYGLYRADDPAALTAVMPSSADLAAGDDQPTGLGRASSR
jgi:hypothetical protein